MVNRENVDIEMVVNEINALIDRYMDLNEDGDYDIHDIAEVLSNDLDLPEAVILAIYDEVV